MKGQYLAVETMLTFTMGIALALATVTTFSSYRSDIVQTTTDKEVQIVQSELRNAIFQLKSADSGNIDIQLPSDIGGSEYSLTLHDGVRVSVNQASYEQGLDSLDRKYEFQGSVDGGTVTLYKRNNQFILRSG